MNFSANFNNIWVISKVVSFIGGGNQSTRKKQTASIHINVESSAPQHVQGRFQFSTVEKIIVRMVIIMDTCEGIHYFFMGYCIFLFFLPHTDHLQQLMIMTEVAPDNWEKVKTIFRQYDDTLWKRYVYWRFDLMIHAQL